MSRFRLVAALAGAGAVVLCPQVSALVAPDTGGGSSPAARSTATALSLLEDAARAARTRTWSATQHVVSLSDGSARVTDVSVVHVPGRGSRLGTGSAGDLLAADVLDDALLSVLAQTYDLAVVGRATCHGRPAVVVEARRPGVAGPAGVAGRFWLDDASSLVLRREVLGADGALVRSSEVVGLRVAPVTSAAPSVETAGQALRPRGERLSAEALAVLASRGWPVPRTLPGGLVLFDARLLDGDVLQLAYSDGLTTLSLFGQQGHPPALRSGVVRQVAGATVWQSPDEPGRLVWGEHGRTWTLVSEAPPDVVDAVVAALPHGGGPVEQDGVGPRVWRGLARVGSWLNPFD